MRTSPPKRYASLTPDLFKQFTEARSEYHSRFKRELLLVDKNGKLLWGKPYRVTGDTEKERCKWRALAISEALRWGQPSMIACSGDYMIWAVPVMYNNRILGGLVARPCAIRADEENARAVSEILSEACDQLLDIAEKHNLTNAAFLRLNRTAAFVEREKAEAIHESKKGDYSDLREVYHLEEPSLLHAIQQGDRNRARAIINRLLLRIYRHQPMRLNFVKSFAMELIVMMSRTAVDAGADSTRIMGMNSGHFSSLANIDDEEELSLWMKETLGKLMDEIQSRQRQRRQVHLSHVVGYIESHLAENISRDDVAKHCGLSPGHFSHLVSEETGRTFRELLARHRVRRACQLLSRTGRSLAEIALDCGFADQSYFTKLFRKWTGQNPLQYRKTLASSASAKPSFSL
jgi:AraC-like DNA-binding protein